MTTLDEAKQIVLLFSKLDGLNKRLAEIEEARSSGTHIAISFKMKNPEGRWGDIDGLKFNETFPSGEASDIASIVLARISDRVAAQKRKVECELASLGARL